MRTASHKAGSVGPPRPVGILVLFAFLLAAAAGAAPSKSRSKSPLPADASPLAPNQPETPKPDPAGPMLPAPAVRTLPAPGDPEFEFGGPLRVANTNSTASAAEQPTAPAPPNTPAQSTPQPTESDWITSDAQPGAELVVQVVPPRDSVLVAGLFVRHIKVVVRNRTTDRAVALRGIRWVNGRGRHDWVKSLPGRSRVEAIGTVILEPGSGNSEIWFEHGLLLPGECLRLALPLTPQPPGLHELEVEYISLGDATRPYPNHVLIRSAQPGPPETYTSPDEMSLAARGGNGGLGLLRAALDPNAPVPDAIRVPFRVGLPLAAGEWLSQLTGGITCVAAMAAAEVHPESGRLFYYVDAVPAWFFIDPRTGESRALFKDGGQWTPTAIGQMQIAAPDVMCNAPDGSTSALLNPSEFGDLLAVQTPWVGNLYNPGKTYIPSTSLRSVLQRAAQRGIPIRVVAIDPNGLGFESILTIGVQVDVAGRWLNPPLALPPPPPNPGDAPSATPATPIAASPLPPHTP